jgi:TRAP-type C4-dicarboxylate transport system permease small subunit
VAGVNQAVERITAAIDRACEAGAWMAAVCCAALAAMLFVESISTAAFAWSQPWAVEYAAYLCGLTLVLGSGYALRHGAHIRVEMLLNYAPRRLARGIDLACTLLALWIAGFLCAGLLELALRSRALNSVSYFAMQTPLWIPQGALALGVALLCLALAARALRLVAGRTVSAPAEADPAEDAAI